MESILNKKILLAENTIDETDIEDLIEWLKGNPWLTQGPLVKEFEQAWAKWLAVPYAVFVNSGSSANLLMVYAHLLSEPRNKKIVLPAVSWATTVAPAIQLGLQPILCEADIKTFGLDLNHLEEILRKDSPAAVMPVHVLGVPNDMAPLLSLKSKYGFSLLEDTCAATGSKYRNQRVGTFGEMSTFSFFFGHHMSTIEGGMVCTSRKDFYEILLQIRSHGWAKDLDSQTRLQKARETGLPEFHEPFTFYYPGFNVRSTDLNARIGLHQLKKIDRVVERRAENHKTYQEAFQNIPSFQVQVQEESMISSIAFCALAPDSDTRIRVAKTLRKAGIETRPLGGGNMSRQPFWKKYFPVFDFPVADRIMQTCFQLPNHPGIDSDKIRQVASLIQQASES